jgi:hypothetical protein
LFGSGKSGHIIFRESLEKIAKKTLFWSFVRECYLQTIFNGDETVLQIVQFSLETRSKKFSGRIAQ